MPPCLASKEIRLLRVLEVPRSTFAEDDHIGEIDCFVGVPLVLAKDIAIIKYRHDGVYHKRRSCKLQIPSVVLSQRSEAAS